MRSLFGLMNRFRNDRRANVAVIFAIACVPLISAIGCAIDYSEATRIKAKMQSAADAAAVAAISQNSAGWLAASTMTSNGPVTVAQTDATNVFNGNVTAASSLYNSLVVTSTVTKTSANLTSTVSFSANVPVTFMKVVGWSQLTVTGSSSATSSLPLYLDFYVMLDVSGSMGLPSTTSEATRMQSINPDNWVQYEPGNCTLACHFAAQNSACVDPPVTPPAAPPANPPTNTTSYTQQYNTNSYCMGYLYSRLSQSALSTLLNMPSTSSVKKQVPGFPVAMISTLTNSTTGSNSLVTGNSASSTWALSAASSCPTAGTDSCIQLRLDAVGYAVNQLLATALQKEVVPDQFRIGLYPYITSMNQNYSPLTYSITGSAITSAAANLASLLDTNADSSLGSGGTDQDAALISMNSVIGSVGNGSATNSTLPYVFIVTDGPVTPQTKGVPNGNWGGSNHDTVIPTPDANCTNLKNRGIKVSILYIPFQPITPPNTVFAGGEDVYANNNIPNISPSLSACASPPDSSGSYFYTANTPTDINNALQAMFNHALVTAHVTN